MVLKQAKGADYSLPPFEIPLQSLLLSLRLGTVRVPLDKEQRF